MIPGKSITWQSPAGWQRELARAIRTPAELLAILGVDHGVLNASIDAHRQFPVRVPRGFVARMRQGDSHDPLLRQVLPVDEELSAYPGFTHDPVGDAQATQSPGVIHKYHGRVLLITTGACAVHCRYCFRRHYPYNDSHAASDQWHYALDYLRVHKDVHEVILSGGDPLSLSDDRLFALVHALDTIPHLKILRLHTRQPIVLPERIDNAFLSSLRQVKMQTVMVLHSNHANEIDASVIEAIRALKTANVTLLNQSVLLKNINDNADTLAQLSWRLFENGVQPYYLHLLDRVAGAGHFEVSEVHALQIYHDLSCKLPGYCVPRLVREQAGAPFKLPLRVNYSDPQLLPGVTNS